MRKILYLFFSMCCLLSMGQVKNLGTLKSSSGVPEHQSLVGHTALSYELVKASASGVKTYVKRSKSDVSAGKAEVILEAHKVFGEFAKIGFQMLLDADATAYGDLFYDWSGGYYGTYDDFEYKIPEGADPSDKSENVVYDDAVAIEVPAGKYDFMIVYPFPDEGLYMPEGEFTKYDDFEFKEGFSYRFVVEYAPNEYGFNTPTSFLFADIDAAISNLLLPANGMDMTDSEDITIEIYNRGVNTITGFEVSYQINDNAVVTEIYTGEIAAGEKATYTFTAKADLSEERQYEVKAWLKLEDDMISSNDSMTGKCKHIGVAQLPYFNDMSTGMPDALESDWIVENLNDDYSEWMYSEWTEGVDGTMGALSCSGSYGEGNDNLISLPIALKAGDNHLIIHTKCVNSETTELLDVRYGTTTNVDEMTVIGDFAVAQTIWEKRVINFNVAQDGVYYFAFHVKSIDGMNLFIDDLTIDAGYYAVSPDLQVVDIVLPYSNCDLSDQSPVGVTLKNAGTGPSSVVELSLSVNGTVVSTEEIAVEIAPMTSETVYFEATADFAEVGEYEVEVTVSVDSEVQNTLTKTVTNYAPVTDLPVFTNFSTGENYNEFWTEMTPGAWTIDDFMGLFGTGESGLENGLLSHCVYLDKSVRVRLQYAKGGYDRGGIYIAFGKSGTDVSTYEKVYECNNILESSDVEFIVPVTDPDSYSFVIVNESEEYVSIYLNEFVLSAIEDYDLRLEDATAPYSKYTPVKHAAEESEFSAVVTNRGAKASTNVVVLLYQDGQLLASSEPVASIAADERVNIRFDAKLSELESNSMVDLEMKVIAAEEDAYMADNEYKIQTINITEDVFATEDLESVTFGTGMWGETLSVGNLYTLAVADVVDTVTVGFVELPEDDPGMLTKPIGIAIYEVGDDLTLGRKIAFKQIERGLGGMYEISFDPMYLMPGRYFVEVEQISTSNMGLGIEEAEDNLCYMNTNGQLLKVAGVAIVVRLNSGSNATVYESDAAPIEFVSPAHAEYLYSDSEVVAVKVKNMGYGEVVTPVKLSVNGVEYESEISLLPYEEKVVEFADIDLSKSGEYDIVASTMLEGDENADNDMISTTLVSAEEQNPYYMDFEHCVDFDASFGTFNPRWRTVDRNQCPTDFYWMFEYPHRGEPVGFMAFNPEATVPAVTADNLPGLYPHSGQRFGLVFIPTWDSPAEMSDAWLISPKLKLENDSKLELYVKTRYLESADMELEPYRILISDTDDEFESFVVLGDDVRKAAVEDWELVEVDLSAYNNKDVYVAIQYIGNKNENVALMVDDIKIHTVTSVESMNATGLLDMYYNANSDEVVITSANPVERVEIYNMQGQLIDVTTDLQAGRSRIDVEGFASGVYVVKANTEKQSATIRFVVK